MLDYENGHVENAEVQKLKYGNGITEVRRKAVYQCLVSSTDYTTTVLRPCR